MGAPQGGLFRAIVQLMMRLVTCFTIACLAAGDALAQQAPPKTTEAQARSYLLSAFITGAAPKIVSESVQLAPGLRERLQLPQDADHKRIYDAIAADTVGPRERLRVRSATDEEIGKSGARQAEGRPLYAMEAGESTYVLQYDLDKDNVVFISQIAAPVPPPLQAAPRSEPPVVSPAPPPPAPQPVVAPLAAPPSPPPPPAPVAAPPPPVVPVAKPAAPPAPQQRVFDTVEPKVPAPKPAAAPLAPVAPAAAMAKPAAKPSGLRRDGPCVVKPVMSDQDMANCGGAPSAGAPAVVESKAAPRPTGASSGETSAKPAAPQAAALKRSGPCVIKPVMSDQDLANCR